MVMVTSIGQRGDAAALEEIGFSGYLNKPVRQSQLHDCIAIVLGRAGQTSEVFKTPDVFTAPQSLVTRHTVAEYAQMGGRILLVEDNIINQKVAQGILAQLGYRADVAANGLEALQALEMIDYDLVLMDCLMPEMDGFEATVMIRSPDSKVLNRNVPIIAMTANAMKGDREKCLESGMNDYLSKPVKIDELAEMLGKWLARGTDKETTASEADEQPVTLPLFDESDMVDRLGDNQDFIAMILNEALQELPKQLQELRKLLTGDDSVEIRRSAHTIKGMAGNISAKALSEICQKLETTAAEGAVESARELMPQLERTVALTIEAIRGEV
jgi:CheY-like chemotaxis protein/HPt (histidine-containing phosphotransfer) domain-containing protein